MAEEIEIIVTTQGFDKVQTGLKQTSDQLGKTANEAKKTGDALRNNLQTGSNQASQSLTNLSRIAQDAPFGFIGIANNLNPLVESFGRLKQESGSTGGALKALVAGLSGPGGLGLAFSAVTAAITFAQVGFTAWSRGSKEAKDASKDFNAELKSLQEELKNVTTDLDDFIKVTDQALKLNDINIKARFTDETEQGVLQRQAKFITISEQLVAATKAREQATINLDDIVRAAFKTEEDYNAARKAGLDVYNATLKKEQELIDARELQAAVNRAATEEDKRNAAKRLKSIETIADIIAKLRKDISVSFKISDIFNLPDSDTAKQQFGFYESTIKKLIEQFNLNRFDPLIIKLTGEARLLKPIFTPQTFEKIKVEANKDVEKNLSGGITIPVDLAFMLDKTKLTDKIPEIKKTLEVDIAEPINKFVEDTFTSIGVSVGEALGAALSGGNISDIFGNFLQILASGITTLGQKIIEIGTLALLAKQSLKTLILNPYAAIAVGIALTALGAAMRNINRNNGFAVGTRNAPGGMALVGERGPELVNLPGGSQVIPATQTAQMLGGAGGRVEVYGVLRGQDIFFSNRKYSQTYNRQT
jgi:phage-related tail protein